MTPESTRATQAELRMLLRRWDPLGVHDDTSSGPPDEYDCLIGPLLDHLDRGASRVELRGYLRSEIRYHFGLDPALVHTDVFADLLLVRFQAPSAERGNGFSE